MRRTLTLPVAMVAMVALSACGSNGSDDSSGTSDQTTATPSASAPAPSPSAPAWSATEAPVEPTGQENTEAGADAYGQFVLTAAFYGYATGDAKPIVTRGDEAACTGCAQLQKFQDSPARKRQVPSSQPLFEMTKHSVDGDFVNLEYAMDIPAGTRIDESKNNAETDIPAAADVPARVNLKWDSDHWVLMNFTLGN